MLKFKSRSQIPYRALALVALVVAIMVLSKLFHLGDRLSLARDWISSLGNAAPYAFIGLYILATILALPGSAITVGAGAIFGSFWGVVYVSVASTVGATLAFLIARYLARESVSHWLEGNPKFQRLDELTRKKGGVIVALTRLIPLFPFNLLNYGFGLTHVKFSTYVLCSWLCMLPGTVLYVVGGDVIYEALITKSVPWLLVAIVVGILILLYFLSHRFRKQFETS